MNKVLTSAIALIFISAMFLCCKKDDNSTATNSITITGTFTIGDKTYTNPTFDIGDPNLHKGIIRPNYQVQKYPTSNMIYIEPVDIYDLGNNIALNYYYSIYSDAVGADISSSAYIGVYLNSEKGEGVWLYCDNLLTTVTKVGEVDDYIEGTYEGLFTESPAKKDVVEYPVAGKFKVKRYEFIEK